MNPILGLGVFETFGVLALVAVVLGALIWFFNSRAFRDLITAGRAQVGKMGTAARNADPQAVMQQEIRDAQEGLNAAITDLEESKAMVGELEEQVKSDAREVKNFEVRVHNSLTDDPDDKGGKAADYVMQLDSAQKRFDTNSGQLATAKKLYANNLEKFRLAQGKIKQAQERARNIGAEVKSSETNARLAKLAQKFNVDVGGLDSRLGEAEAEARRQVARNNAVSEVQTDLGMDGVEEAREEERLRKAEAKKKLDAIRTKMGLDKPNA